MQESLGSSPYKDQLSPQTSVCFIFYQSNTSLQPPAEVIFKKFVRNSSMASKMKDRKVCAPCALCVRTEIFWKHAIFNTFQSLYGILFFIIDIEYCLTTTWRYFYGRRREIYRVPPVWHALQDNYGALPV